MRLLLGAVTRNEQGFKVKWLNPSAMTVLQLINVFNVIMRFFLTFVTSISYFFEKFLFLFVNLELFCVEISEDVENIYI